MSALLKQLGNYIIAHFKAEEAYMAKSGYPQLETHQVIHPLPTARAAGFFALSCGAARHVKQP